MLFTTQSNLVNKMTRHSQAVLYIGRVQIIQLAFPIRVALFSELSLTILVFACKNTHKKDKERQNKTK